MNYRDDLQRGLTAVGISGRLRARILAEIDDHLECDPDAELGAPEALAAQFADELGTARARRAGFTSFAALALAGVLFAVAFVTSPGAAFGALPADTPWPGRVANWIGVLAPQVAFAAGVLAALRAFHRRREGVIAAAEAEMIRRRARVGLIAGIASLASLGVLAVELRHHLPSWWVTLAEVCAVVGLLGLLVAVPALRSADRVRSRAPGGAGDLFDDVGDWLPGVLRRRPWQLAWALAGGIFVLLTVTGIMASDGYDGAIRGVIDGIACLLGFATIGRYLGLWTPASP